jgi:hypothetical protein
MIVQLLEVFLLVVWRVLVVKRRVTFVYHQVPGQNVAL